MTISQKTTIQAYQLNKGGARARMAIFRMIAAESVNYANPHCRLTVGDWKGARRYTMGSYAASYCAGINQGQNQWYAHTGEQFRNERDCGEIRRMDHSGYYTDVHSEGLAIGIVASLTHGRFIAGYRWTDNDERVYFPEIYTDENDAAYAADSHAESFADKSRDDSQKYSEANALEMVIEESVTRLKECIVLRHNACMKYVRDEITELIQTIRDSRESLATDYKDYI